MGRTTGSKNKTTEEVKTVDTEPAKDFKAVFATEDNIFPTSGTIPKKAEESIEIPLDQAPVDRDSYHMSFSHLKTKDGAFRLWEVPNSMILVDKRLFYKLMMTSVSGIPHRGNAAVSRFAELLGITDSEKQIEFWQQDVQEYLAKDTNG